MKYFTLSLYDILYISLSLSLSFSPLSLFIILCDPVNTARKTSLRSYRVAPEENGGVPRILAPELIKGEESQGMDNMNYREASLQSQFREKEKIDR